MRFFFFVIIVLWVSMHKLPINGNPWIMLKCKLDFNSFLLQTHVGIRTTSLFLENKIDSMSISIKSQTLLSVSVSLSKVHTISLHASIVLSHTSKKESTNFCCKTKKRKTRWVYSNHLSIDFQKWQKITQDLQLTSKNIITKLV